MDFFKVRSNTIKKDVCEVYPDFIVTNSKDLVIKYGAFHAVWDEENNIWSTNEFLIQRIVDKEVWKLTKSLKETTQDKVIPRTLENFSTGKWNQWRNYTKNLVDSDVVMDNKITFKDTVVVKKDYVSKRVSYNLENIPIPAYTKLSETLYHPEELDKIEWAIGAVLANEARYIQKFLVLYGSFGTGKSTIISLLEKLFEGYYTSFNAKDLANNSNQFPLETFKDNPLVAIQHDGDLSKIEDNTRLNSLSSHEMMTMNIKNKSIVTTKINAFLFMGTNSPVKITDSRSGIIRRLIDVTPTGTILPVKEYQSLVSQLEFELGGIAHHCLEKYRQMGRYYYADYIPILMIQKTDIFYNYVEQYYDIFRTQDGCTLKQAYELYNIYCTESNIEYKKQKHLFREELKSYFSNFDEITRIDGKQVRSYFSGFLKDKFFISQELTTDNERPISLILDKDISILDEILSGNKAQLANSEGFPSKKWDQIKTRLHQIDTTQVHYVQVGGNHIVIDFDLKNSEGKKDKILNLEAASKFPPTYTEYSKGGNGIHLHYIYEGDVSELASVYSPDIEVKKFVGGASLRRRLTKCNNLPIARISSGLPIKEKKEMINVEVVSTEQVIRRQIRRNLNKEIHDSTICSINLIHKILQDAYNSDLIYDVTDLKKEIVAFGLRSTNQSNNCIKAITDMKFTSKVVTDPDVPTEVYAKRNIIPLEAIVFFDVEVFPNLLLICWKINVPGAQVQTLINPTPQMIEPLLSMNLVGFNNKMYDNHIIYAAYIGYTNIQIYQLSASIVESKGEQMLALLFREAYNISHADIYAYTTNKQSLKKYMVELGLNHIELEFDWHKPLHPKYWPVVDKYCQNDVNGTQAVFYNRITDYNVMQFFSEVSDLPINSSITKHAERIIFGLDKTPQSQFVYTDLSKEFPGYEFNLGLSMYRGINPSEGGYVFTAPGVYYNVHLYDIKSMHPHSLIALNAFGDEYTARYAEMVDTRLAVNEGRIEDASKMMNGLLAKYLDEESKYPAVSHGLKLLINRIYGLTFTSNTNLFIDPRNKDNFIAKRGALFMIDLQFYLEEIGVKLIHIKTDSIKIVNPTESQIKKIDSYTRSKHYTFAKEAEYEKLCILNKSAYIAKDREGIWHPTGTEFIHPYIFKTLFTKEEVVHSDLVELRTVSGGAAMYLNFIESNLDNYKFIGRASTVYPVKPNTNGGRLMRSKDKVKYDAVIGTKDFLWKESMVIDQLNKHDEIDMSYFEKKAAETMKHIAEYTDAKEFIK